MLEEIEAVTHKPIPQCEVDRIYDLTLASLQTRIPEFISAGEAKHYDAQTESWFTVPHEISGYTVSWQRSDGSGDTDRVFIGQNDREEKTLMITHIVSGSDKQVILSESFVLAPDLELYTDTTNPYNHQRSLCHNEADMNLLVHLEDVVSDAEDAMRYAHPKT